MIGTDENRAVLHVEVIFWSGKTKDYHPAWSVESIVPILWSQEPLNIWVYAFWTEPSVVHLMTPALGNAQPLYPDTVDYGPLENNAEFLIYEGANAVGKGRVLGRTVPYQVKQQRK